MIGKNKLILGLVILIAGSGLAVLIKYNRNSGQIAAGPEIIISPTVSPSPSPSAVKGIVNLGKAPAKDLQSFTPEEVESLFDKQYLVQQTVPYSQLTKPATCAVAGTLKVDFRDGYQLPGAKLSYTGIDSPARQIKWTVSPGGEDIIVGPNIMAQLKLPDGENMVSVVLPPSTRANSYTLTAVMTYGRLVDNGVRVYEVACSGQADVEIIR